jgi:hypothetical protein
MKPLRVTWFVCKGCLKGVGTVVLWTLWLVLGLALLFQLRIASSRELSVPPLLLRKLESRLADEGLRVKFGNAQFDPSGHVALKQVELSNEIFNEPLLSAGEMHFQINPWAAIAGSVVVRELRFTDATLQLPGMVSPSGRHEPLLREVQATLAMEPGRLTIRELTGRFENLTVAVRGAVALPKAGRREKRRPAEMLGSVVQAYLKSGRRIAALAPELAAFEKPRMEIVLVPDAAHVALAELHVKADRARWPAARFKLGKDEQAVIVDRPFAQTAAPLSLKEPWTLRVTSEAKSIELPQARTEGFRAAALGTLGTDWKIEPRELALTLGRIDHGREQIQPVNIRLLPGPLPQVRAEIGGRVFDELWHIEASADLKARTATVDASTRISHALLAFAGHYAKRDLNALLQPAAPADLRVKATFTEGWKPGRVQGSLASGPVVVRTVPLDGASADFTLRGKDLLVDRIILRQGESDARGLYSMNTATRDYRFLLSGVLRPAGIGGWFGDWWPRFWSNFDFTSRPPKADIDVQGRWGAPHLSTVFVSVDALSPRVRKVAFDQVRTSLFIRPDFYEALELTATRGSGEARGTFRRQVDLRANTLRRMDFSVTSDLDLFESARIFEKAGTDLVEPFVFERPPKLVLSGRLDGPAGPNGAHENADIQVTSSGAFGFYGFPLSNLSFRAALRDDELKIHDLNVSFAGGRVTARAELSGKSPHRRLGFDGAIDDANLGLAISTLERFGAARKGETPPPQSKFQQRLAGGRLGLRLSADGLYSNPFSFRGNGSSEITGAELAEVNLLGALSRVLDFTSLRLDAARANFKLEGPNLTFSELRITGPTAAIDARGTYQLEQRKMDFNARVYPFEESRNLFASAVDFVLTPLSNVLELKLSGSLEQPDWRFVYGPTSFLRSITGDDKSAPKPGGSKARTPPPSLRR